MTNRKCVSYKRYRCSNPTCANYNPLLINSYSDKSIGIDPGFGSSLFGIYITQFVDGQIQVLYAQEYERPDFNEMIDLVARLAHNYGFTLQNGKILVDDVNPCVI